MTRQKARTILTIIAIVIGSLSVVLMLSLVTGAKKVLFSSMEEMGALSLITVTGDPNSAQGSGLFSTGGGGDTIEGKKLDNKTVSDFKKMDRVEDVTPLASNIWAKNMKLEGQDKKFWANAIGYDPDTQVINIKISAGRGLNKNDMDKIVIGSDLLRELGYASKANEIIGKNMLFIFEGGYYPDWGEDPPKPPMGDNKDWWED